MGVDLWRDSGTPVEQQRFTWKELVQAPYSKLSADAFTRVRVLLMNGVEADALRLKHAMAKVHRKLQPLLAQIRRIEHHQQTMVNWLNPADQSPLETTLGLEQVAIEVTASVAQREPDPYLAQVYRFGLLEDFDHLYRFGALYDRLDGKDPNSITQSYTDILPGRPTSLVHRHPSDDLRLGYDRFAAHPLTKLHALAITAAELQTHDYYMTIGPMFADPGARQLYAEIASIEEQHVTQYESISDADESWLEKWVLHEAMEVWCYQGCVAYETDPRIKAIWERFLDYELGQLAMARKTFEDLERRDVQTVLPEKLPDLVEYKEHREFVRTVLSREVDLRAHGTELVDKAELPANSPTHAYREYLNSEGSPSETVAAGWKSTPATQTTRKTGTRLRPTLAVRMQALAKQRGSTRKMAVSRAKAGASAKKKVVRKPGVSAKQRRKPAGRPKRR